MWKCENGREFENGRAGNVKMKECESVEMDLKIY